MTTEECRQFIGQHLEDIAQAMPPEYKLTFVMRHTGNLDADIVLTDDDLTKASDAILKLQKRTEGQQGNLIVAEK